MFEKLRTFLSKPGKEGKQAVGCKGVGGVGKISLLLMFIKNGGGGILSTYLVF